jgi:Pentapeptide repeats (8 copies)
MRNRRQLNVPAHEVKSFKKQDLQGRTFSGQNLSGADFSDSDIRGADFTNAILTNANFANARTGLQMHTTILFTLLLLLTAVVLGIVAGLSAGTIGLQFHSNYLAISAKIIAISVHCGFLIVALRRGLTASFSIFAVAFALAFAAAVLYSGAIPTAAAIALAIVLDFLVASLTMVAVGMAIITWIVVNAKMGVMVAIAFAGTFLSTIGFAPTSISATMIVITVMILSGYVSWQTLRNREYIRTLAGVLFARWGTSFRGSDLTGANFSNTVLKNTDFRRAVVTSARWQELQFDFLMND